MEYYYVLILVGAVLAFMVIRTRLTYFKCPKCGTEFRMGFFRYVFASHFLNKRMAKCPSCGHADMLAPKWGKPKE